MNLLKKIVVIGGILVASVSNCQNSYIVDKGSTIGYVNKFSEEGRIWKTHEGTLAMQGFSYPGAELWNFSLDKQARNGEDIEKLKQDIEEYKDSNTLVKIEYLRPWKVWPWRARANNLVQKISSIEE